MTTAGEFKIDRCQRIHSDGLVFRVYQVFGTTRYGWDHNREKPPTDRPLHDSPEQAQRAADMAHQLAGHTCNDACYGWRLFG